MQLTIFRDESKLGGMCHTCAVSRVIDLKSMGF